eukprot:6911688-Prymnesium_polylepis.1
MHDPTWPEGRTEPESTRVCSRCPTYRVREPSVSRNIVHVHAPKRQGWQGGKGARQKREICVPQTQF